ncbi:hypothetical protein L0337_39125 [candidate division KSB1 bacterium]|nr:hypothetical protein [candidate division KSB1 bacterium]
MLFSYKQPEAGDQLPLIKIHIAINFVIVILTHQHENGRLRHDEVILALTSLDFRFFISSTLT